MERMRSRPSPLALPPPPLPLDQTHPQTGTKSTERNIWLCPVYNCRELNHKLPATTNRVTRKSRKSHRGSMSLHCELCHRRIENHIISHMLTKIIRKRYYGDMNTHVTQWLCLFQFIWLHTHAHTDYQLLKALVHTTSCTLINTYFLSVCIKKVNHILLETTAFTDGVRLWWGAGSSCRAHTDAYISNPCQLIMLLINFWHFPYVINKYTFTVFSVGTKPLHTTVGEVTETYALPKLG